MRGRKLNPSGDVMNTCFKLFLKSYDYYEGKIDGVIGPVSKAASNVHFQTQNGLDC